MLLVLSFIPSMCKKRRSHSGSPFRSGCFAGVSVAQVGMKGQWVGRTKSIAKSELDYAGVVVFSVFVYIIGVTGDDQTTAYSSGER